jgi:plastocyanin
MKVAPRHLAVALAGAVAVASGVNAAYGGSSTASAGAVREVAIPARVFAPGRIQVLVGDTVVWRNGDGTNHTVTSDDDLFDSGFIAPGLTYARAFTRTGTFLYHCTIHKTMRGEVVVVPVALTAPAEPVISGGRIVLQGFAPSGTSRVVVQRLGDGGQVVGRVAPAGDGSFTLSLRVFTPADFNAGAKGRVSPHVHVAVAPKVIVRRSGGEVSVTATPKRPGAEVVLQRYVRELFAWRDVTPGRLGPTSKASVALPRSAGRYRAVVRGSHGWSDGISPTVVVKRDAST